MLLNFNLIVNVNDLWWEENLKSKYLLLLWLLRLNLELFVLLYFFMSLGVFKFDFV